MRRNAQQLSETVCRSILETRSVGVLSLIGDGGYPYGVPLNFVYRNDKLYFHCAQEGHKLDALRLDGKACFTVVAEDTVLEERYTTAYRSVIVFGRAAVAEDPAERRDALLALAKKYAPNRPEAEWRQKAESCEKALLIRLTVEHLAGKQGKALLPKA